MKTTQEQARAILRVAYLLATLDGNVSDVEKKLFQKVGGTYSWFTPGNQKTNNLINDVVSSSEKLLRLKFFYNEQEFLTAFLSETENDCKTIKSSKIVSRQAFAIWLAMCLADKDFSAIERSAIKHLQQSFNSNQRSAGFTSLYGAGMLRQNVETVISDDFLKATEDDCVTLGNLLEQIELAKTPTEKAKFENAYKVIESGLHTRIVGDE